MIDLGLNDSQIVLRMAVSTSKAFIASPSDKRDHNFDLPQIAEISKYFHQHDQKNIFLDHIFSAKDIHLLLEFLNMFPMQGEEFVCHIVLCNKTNCHISREKCM